MRLTLLLLLFCLIFSNAKDICGCFKNIYDDVDANELGIKKYVFYNDVDSVVRVTDKSKHCKIYPDKSFPKFSNLTMECRKRLGSDSRTFKLRYKFENGDKYLCDKPLAYTLLSNCMEEDD